MVTFSTALTKNEQLDKIIKNFIIKTNKIRIHPIWRFERRQYHLNVWCQTGPKEFTHYGKLKEMWSDRLSFLRISLKLCQNDVCSHSNIPKATELNFLLNMYFAILNCWLARKCFNPQGIFGSLTNVITSSRLFLCVTFQVDSHFKGLASLYSFSYSRIRPSSQPTISFHIMGRFCAALLTSTLSSWSSKLSHIIALLKSFHTCASVFTALFSLTFCNWFVILAWISSAISTKLHPAAEHQVSVPKTFTAYLSQCHRNFSSKKQKS